MKRKIYQLVAIFMIASLISFTEGEKTQTDLHLVNGIAIGGYDAVAYFTKKKALKGDSSNQFQWHGAIWYFTSIENRKLFENNPGMYVPQYGGYCAYGASNGYKAKTDPTAWTIVEQKLYLNYNAQVKTVWLPDTTARIKTADQYWESLSKINN